MNEKTVFYLPVGYPDSNGIIHRRGVMRALVVEDELALQDLDSVTFNDRIRDLELMARVIISLGDLPSVDSDILQNLYESDFIYLQMLFNALNQNGGDMVYNCPHCGKKERLDLPLLFKEIDAVADIKEEFSFRLPQGSGLVPEMGSKVKGTMVLARVKDFIALYHDSRCRENASWFYVGLLSRCIKKLDSKKSINNSVITKLSPVDFSFLIDLFNEINNGVIRTIRRKCDCGTDYRVELVLPGEV